VQISRAHQDLLDALRQAFGPLAVIQSVICYVAILIAPGLIGIARGGVEMVPIFRFGVLGALFHTFLLLGIVLVSYFDLRRTLLHVSAVFFCANAVLTSVLIPLGPAYYGYGYFLASLVSLVYAYGTAYPQIKKLPYVTLIANNRALR